MSTQETCVCYTTDNGYLFPSFVSAVQARRNSSPEQTDVLLVGIDIDPEARRVFDHACGVNGIRFQCHGTADIGHAPAMLARLFLSDLLPKDYQRFLYVDGDTQIHGDLGQLFQQPLPSGSFAAVADPMTCTLGDEDSLARSFREYFTALGLSSNDASRYFNSGVIYAERDGWAHVGREAWKIYGGLRTRTRYPDQDALNLVGLSRCVTMSFAWNFPGFFCNLGLDEEIFPTIYHFMSAPKPWEGVFPPWDETAFTPYTELAAAYPGMEAYWRRMSLCRRVRYALQQRYKRWLERRDWQASRLERIRAYEARARIRSRAAA